MMMVMRWRQPHPQNPCLHAAFGYRTAAVAAAATTAAAAAAAAAATGTMDRACLPACLLKGNESS